MKNKALFSYVFFTLFVIFFAFSIVFFPAQAVKSAREGLYLWLNILVPSLLPFLIASYILVNLKTIDIIGIFIQPIAKFFFNVSGKGSLIFVMSVASGYPVGSKLTSELRLQNNISNIEAQRLACFCSTSGPLFIIGAIGIGMFKSASIGYFIATVHYISAFTIGVLFRYYKLGTFNRSSCPNSIKNIKQIIKSKTHENFFTLLSNAIHDSINTMLTIGGFIIIFSVLLEIFKCLNVIDSISNFLFLFLRKLNISKELIHAFLSGLFEMTLGCKNVVSCDFSSTLIKIALSSFIVSFGGLSILAQSCNFLNKCDINLSLFIASKFLHGVLSFIYSLMFYPVFKNTLETSANFNITSNNLYIGFKYILTINKLIVMIIVFIYILDCIYKICKKK